MKKKMLLVKMLYIFLLTNVYSIELHKDNKNIAVVNAGADKNNLAQEMLNEQKRKLRFEKLELFNKVLYLIESQYYREVDSTKLIEGAISGMMNTLDPHSGYLDKEVFSKMQEETSGEFGGLGIEVTQKNGVLFIVTPIEDSPAEKAGIKAGDKIVQINNESIVGLTLDASIEKLKGKLNTKIVLGIVREGTEGIKNYEISREVVKISPVKFDLIQDSFAYVRLTQFQKKSGEYISNALKKMKEQLPKKYNEFSGIILDLRSNPGGLLDEAIEVTSIFIKEGVVVSTEGRDNKNRDIRYVKDNKQLKDKYLTVPMVVLVNGQTASASEIVSGALQDYKRAIIMGTTTFGKGSVQSVAKIDEQSGVKLTIAQYMTPKGRRIQAVGVTPDVLIDEAEGDFVEFHRTDSNNIIREKDLKNHLTATVESPEEKKSREEEENKDRRDRVRKYKDIKEKKLNKKNKDKNEIIDDEGEIKKINPHEDYHVHEAIKYLKSLPMIKDILQK